MCCYPKRVTRQPFQAWVAYREFTFGLQDLVMYLLFQGRLIIHFKQRSIVFRRVTRNGYQEIEHIHTFLHSKGLVEMTN